MAAGAGIPGNIINELLSTRKYATERVEQFTKKRFYPEKYRFMNPYNAIL